MVQDHRVTAFRARHIPLLSIRIAVNHRRARQFPYQVGVLRPNDVMFHPARRQHGVHSPLRRTGHAGPLAAALDLDKHQPRRFDAQQVECPAFQVAPAVRRVVNPPPAQAQQVNYPRLILRFALR